MKNNYCQVDKWHCYWVGPIDFWFGTLEIDDVIKQLEIEKISQLYEERSGCEACTLINFCALWEEAQRALEKADILWEGDGWWSLSAVPDHDCGMYLIFYVKQANNGSTFVVSQVALPYLEKSD